MSTRGSYTPRCRTHSREPSGWFCEACKKYLCVKCAAVELGNFFCVHCEGPARQLTVARSERTFGRLVIEALVFPVRGAPIRLVAISLLLAVLTFVGRAPPPAKVAAPAGDEATPATNGDASTQQNTPTSSAPPDEGSTVRAIALVARETLRLLFIVLIVGAAARAGKKEPGLWTRLVQAGLATLIVWGPGVVYLLFVQQGFPDRTMLRDPDVWLLAGLGFFYLPIALAVTAGDASFLAVLNPFNISASAWSVRGRYGVTLLLLAVLIAIVAFADVRLANLLLRLVRVRFLADWLGQLIEMGLLVVMAHLIGSLTHIFGYRFGWGRETAFHDPILGDARTEGTLKRWAEQLAKLSKVAPSQGGAARSRLPQDEMRLAREIADCVNADNVHRAFRIYQMRPSWSDAAFEPKDRLLLGNAAVRAKKADVARSLLEPLIDRGDLMAARAMVALAQLHGEQLKDLDTSAKLYQRVLDEFPRTDLAQVAKRKLGK